MSAQLQNKTILVTGAAKRVGAAIARRLHRAGARLELHYHVSEREAHSLQIELNLQRPQSVILVKADLLETSGLAEIVKTCDERDWDALVGANLKAPLFLSQAAAPHLRKSGGCIVNITDIHAERPLKNYVVYSIAKAGLAGLTRSLARELGPEVRVNAVAPGPIVWPEDGSFDEVTRQRVISHTLLRRIGEPDDIARAVYYLIAEAPYVTGQIIAVDGGRSVNL